MPHPPDVPSPHFSSPWSQLLVLLAAIFLAGCSKAPDVTVRELDEDEQAPKVNVTSSERFKAVAQMVGMGGGKGQPSSKPNDGGPRLVWKTPEGWTEIPSAMMRDANFTFGANGEGECYVSRLTGDGGGLEANVNRWRKQMGLSPATPEEVAGLPHRETLGRESVFVQLDGDYSSVGAATAKKDQRLLGLIVIVEGGGLFVKMIGPKALVEQNSAQFDSFCESLDIQVQ